MSREARQQRIEEARQARQQRRDDEREARQQRRDDEREARQQRRVIDQAARYGMLPLLYDRSYTTGQDEPDDDEKSPAVYKTTAKVEPRKVASKFLPKKQINMGCPLIQLTYEWVQSLNWPSSVFNKAFDRCYCENCYPSDWEDVELVAGCKYVIPRGWVRLGLHVDESFADIHQIWSDWIVCYHGTSQIAALSILSHHHFYLPGDKLMDGTVLGIRDGHIPGKKHIYTSPSIAYSSLPAYSPIYAFHSTMNGANYYVQLVLQCRQKPDTFYVQAETVGSGKQRICSYIPNNVIEHYTEIRSSIVAYGLLIRITEQDDY